MSKASVLTACAVLVALAGPASARGIPRSIIPYEHPERWPYDVGSAHFVVHAATSDDLAMAQLVATHLESAWHAQIDVAGSAAPLGDDGVAGPDARIDVYLWRGIDTFYVDEVVDPDDPDADLG